MVDASLLCRESRVIARNIAFRAGYLPDMEQRCGEARRLIGIVLALALVDAGPLAPSEVGGCILNQNPENFNASVKEGSSERKLQGKRPLRRVIYLSWSSHTTVVILLRPLPR